MKSTEDASLKSSGFFLLGSFSSGSDSVQMFQISPVVTGTLAWRFTRLISSTRSLTFCSPR